MGGAGYEDAGHVLNSQSHEGRYDPEVQKKKQIPFGNGKKKQSQQQQQRPIRGCLSTTETKCAAFGRDDNIRGDGKKQFSSGNDRRKSKGESRS